MIRPGPGPLPEEEFAGRALRHSLEYRVQGSEYFTEMCSGSEAGSYLRLIDFVYHSTLGLRESNKEEE